MSGISLRNGLEKYVFFFNEDRNIIFRTDFLYIKSMYKKMENKEFFKDKIIVIIQCTLVSKSKLEY